MDRNAILLVAEDEDGHFALIQKNLRRAGLQSEIRRFTDGQQVVDFLKNQNDDSPKQYVLLLDLRMPKMDGFEVLEHLKAHTQLKKIPVIILTTAKSPQDIETCHQLGCSLYIVKPVEYTAFVEAIRRIGAFLGIIEVPALV